MLLLRCSVFVRGTAIWVIVAITTERKHCGSRKLPVSNMRKNPMKRPLLTFLVILVALPLSALRVNSPADPTACWTFVDVSVVHTDSAAANNSGIERHQTVLIRGNRIAEIASVSELHPPKECALIDGRNRYLIPGLTDSHLHLPLTGQRTNAWFFNCSWPTELLRESIWKALPTFWRCGTR